MKHAIFLTLACCAALAATAADFDIRTYGTACAALLTGCTSFEPLRSTRFVDDNNNYLHVDYGRDTKDHESTAVLENGVSWPFKSKNMVRVELPDGTRFTAYQNMAPTGNLYKTGRMDDPELTTRLYQSGAKFKSEIVEFMFRHQDYAEVRDFVCSKVCEAAGAQHLMLCAEDGSRSDWFSSQWVNHG